MKLRDLKELDMNELKQKKQSLQQELLTVRHQIAMKQIANPLTKRTMRRTIARINTLLREDELRQRKIA